MPRIIKSAKGTFTVATVTIDSDGRVIAASEGTAGGGMFTPKLVATGPSSGTFTSSGSFIGAYLYAGGGSGSPNPGNATNGSSGSSGGATTLATIGTVTGGGGGGGGQGPTNPGTTGTAGAAPGATLTPPIRTLISGSDFGAGGSGGSGSFPGGPPASTGSTGSGGAIVVFDNTGS